MSAISEFAAAVTTYNDRITAAIAGVKEDVKGLKAKIIELQNTPGAITPADQVLLDAIQAKAHALTMKLEALDTETPPVPPPSTV